MAAARRGDLIAWQWIAWEHQELVFRSAYLTNRDSVQAVEVTKSVLARAYRSLSSLEDGADLRAWLLRLTDSVARTRQREVAQSRDARVPVEDPCARLAATPVHLAPGTPTPTPHDLAALADAFDGLTDTDRAVVAARYAFGFDGAAAAARLDAEPDAVHALLMSAVARLRERASGAPFGANAPQPGPGGHPSAIERSRFAMLSDDQLGSMAMAGVMSELSWTPDVAPGVCHRLSREAVAYGAPAAGVGHSSRRDQRPTQIPEASTRPSGSHGLPLSRSLGHVAGATVLVAALVLAGGGSSQRVSGLLADAGSSVGSWLGEPAALQASIASDAGPVEDGVPTEVPAEVPTEVPTEPAAVPDSSAGLSVEAATREPVTSMVGARRFGDGSLKAIVRLDWPATTDDQGRTRARIEQRVGDRAWSPLAWTDAGEPLLVEIEPGTALDLRVRSVDAAGDEAVSPVSRLKLVVRTAGSNRLVRSKGDWKTDRGPSGQRQLVALAPGARVSTEFRGMDVAVLGRLARARDTIGLRIDDQPWVLDPDPIARSGRVVLYREGLDAGRHSLDVRAPADGLAVDAILILRAASV